MTTKAPERPTATEKRSARDRLLDAADELFYEQGIHTVGIDTIIERAGVAKASLYATFGSKDELIRAYLQARHEERNARITNGLEGFSTPREKLVGLFDILGATFARPTFRGCAFINASAESPAGSVVEEVADFSRAWIKTVITDLSRDAGAPDPVALGAQLAMLYDGAVVTARMDRNPAAADTARAAAIVLIAAAIPAT
jgi:AcrR family transcriptional regulator